MSDTSVQLMARAGAETARPLPPREGVSFDALRPLQTFIRHRARASIALEACQAASFWWSFPNLAPKLALGKVELVEETETALVFEGADGTHRILPLGDRAAYWMDILRYAGARKPLALIPGWASNALGKHYDVQTLQKEYLVATSKLQHLNGGSLRNIRNLIHKARRKTTIGFFSSDHVGDYLAVNRSWYRQNAEAKFRTYDKTSIDWMLQNWSELKAAAPDIQCFGVRANSDARLIAFTIASILTPGVWSAYTERFDREHQVQGCNWLLWQEFAHFFSEIEFENDGTADTTALRHNKAKVAAGQATFFKLAP